MQNITVFKSMLTSPSNVLPYYVKQTFPLMILIFTEGEGDGIESRLPFKIFSILIIAMLYFTFGHSYSNKSGTKTLELPEKPKLKPK